MNESLMELRLQELERKYHEIGARLASLEARVLVNLPPGGAAAPVDSNETVLESPPVIQLWHKEHRGIPAPARGGSSATSR
jgi:hypothetical protein